MSASGRLPRLNSLPTLQPLINHRPNQRRPSPKLINRPLIHPLNQTGRQMHRNNPLHTPGRYPCCIDKSRPDRDIAKSKGENVRVKTPCVKVFQDAGDERGRLRFAIGWLPAVFACMTPSSGGPTAQLAAAAVIARSTKSTKVTRGGCSADSSWGYVIAFDVRLGECDSAVGAVCASSKSSSDHKGACPPVLRAVVGGVLFGCLVPAS